MNIFRLADRLHKTPEEIRHSFTVADYEAFLIYARLTHEEMSSK